MRVVKLAVRTVISMRASATASVAVVALVAAVVTMAGSVIAPIRTTIAEAYRVRIRGELTLTHGEGAGGGAAGGGTAGGTIPRGRADSTGADGEASAGADGETGADAGSTDGADSAGAAPWISSARLVEPGVLGVDGELLLARVSRVRLSDELAFRRLESLVDPDAVSSDVAVLLADGPLAATLAERAVRLETPSDRRLVRIAAVGPPTSDGPELLLHDPVSLAGSGTEVRFRGRTGPMDRVPGELAQAGATTTGWRGEARAESRPLAEAGLVLASLLTLLAVGTLVPGFLLLVRRARASFSLLHVWGFRRATIARVVIVMGAFASAAAATAGAGVALGAAAVLNAQGRPAASLLPLDLEQQISPVLTAAAGLIDPSPDRLAPPTDGTGADASAGSEPAIVLTETPVTPSVGWAAAAIAIATLLGAVTALPSSRKAATLVVRRSLWHW